MFSPELHVIDASACVFMYITVCFLLVYRAGLTPLHASLFISTCEFYSLKVCIFLFIYLCMHGELSLEVCVVQSAHFCALSFPRLPSELFRETHVLPDHFLAARFDCAFTVVAVRDNAFSERDVYLLPANLS
jgi:hypothetical protein